MIELGILIFIFLSWQFALAEYLGGIILILIMVLMVKLTLPKKLEERARENAKQAGSESEEQPEDWKKQIRTLTGWRKVAKRYFMEWKMVWKDVAFGFTVAGIITVFVPAAFFQTLFVGSGGQQDPAWWQIVLHTMIGPIAAFFTFIGSMGNIPLAGVLFGSGVSFAGIMAFIYSDLVVFPVLRISSKYFGWRMALYILFVFFVCLVCTALILHYGFGLIGIIPKESGVSVSQKDPSEHFKINYTFFMNLLFLALTAVLGWLTWSGMKKQKDHSDHHHGGHKHHQNINWSKKVLTLLAWGSLVWLTFGVVLWLIL